MAFIEIQRRCQDCETTRGLVRELRAEVKQSLLDYESLYDKVRTNLSKLAKRAERPQEAQTGNGEGDPMAQYRELLARRVLNRRGGTE